MTFFSFFRQTDSEVLNCSHTEEHLKYLWKCLPLQCKNCFVIFELYYLENKFRLDKETKTTIGQSIYFNHDKSVLKARCGLYEIEAFITKDGLGNSSRQSIYIYEDHINMPPDISNVIALKKTINL